MMVGQNSHCRRPSDRRLHPSRVAQPARTLVSHCRGIQGPAHPPNPHGAERRRPQPQSNKTTTPPRRTRPAQRPLARAKLGRQRRGSGVSEAQKICCEEKISTTRGTLTRTQSIFRWGCAPTIILTHDGGLAAGPTSCVLHKTHEAEASEFCLPHTTRVNLREPAVVRQYWQALLGPGGERQTPTAHGPQPQRCHKRRLRPQTPINNYATKSSIKSKTIK